MIGMKKKNNNTFKQKIYGQLTNKYVNMSYCITAKMLKKSNKEDDFSHILFY